MKDAVRIGKHGAVVMPIEQYSNVKKAEFLLSNSIDKEDYQLARQEVIKMGLNPDEISHTKPVDEGGQKSKQTD